MTEIRFPNPAEREKRGRLLEMLDQGKVMIYVDPRRPGVDVPAHLRNEVAVPLNLSHRFGLSVFDVGPLAVKANLSFGGQRHLCVLPYSAIFGYLGHADGARVVFADALPPEVSLIAEQEESLEADPTGDEPTEGSASEGEPTDTQTPDDSNADGRPHLRLLD